MQFTEADPKSQEYKGRYIARLVEKGIKKELAFQDFHAYTQACIDLNVLSVPELDADESLSYWGESI